jgi:6-phosphogluconolactonase
VNLERIFATPKEAAEACGAEILRVLGETVAIRGRASVAFSGGSSPKTMFAWMASQEFDWSPIEIFFVDERCVAPEHADSNYRMTREALLDRIQPGGVHRILGELAPEEAAARYREDLIATLGREPQFDVIHLGMGADSHTASLFPGLPEIDDRNGLAAAVWVEKLTAHRVTLLPRVLLEAKQVVMLVTGQDKAPAMREVFRGSYAPLTHPAQLIHRNAPLVEWYIDRAAKGAE